MKAGVHRDGEIPLFYWIAQGAGVFTLVLVLVTGTWREANGWVGVVVPLVSIVGFGLFGWPITATVGDSGQVRFRNLFLSRAVRPGDVRRLKYVASGVGEHVVLKLRWRFPFYRFDIGYRVSRYTDPAPLAAAVARLGQTSPGCVWDDGARRLLNRVAAPALGQDRP